MLGYANLQVDSWGHTGINNRESIGNDSISYRCVPGVGVSGVPRPVPGRTNIPETKKGPYTGPLASMIIYGHSGILR